MNEKKRKSDYTKDTRESKAEACFEIDQIVTEKLDLKFVEFAKKKSSGNCVRFVKCWMNGKWISSVSGEISKPNQTLRVGKSCKFWRCSQKLVGEKIDHIENIV